MNQYKPITSFTQKPSIAQVVSYILFILQVTTFYIIIQSNYQSQISRIIFHIFYGISILGQIISTIITSCIDPSDQMMISYVNDKQNARRKFQDIQNNPYCGICVSFVKQKSKHCKICQRCVQDFDHHCMWINNCIGSKNYISFVFMISFTFTSMVIYISSIAVLWVQNYWDSYLAEMIVLWVSGFIVCVFIILIFNLILLHIYLGCKGITTYEFIILEKQNERLKEIQKQIKKKESNDLKRVNVMIKQKDTVKVDESQQHSQLQQQRNITEENLRVKKKIQGCIMNHSQNQIFQKKLYQEKSQKLSRNNIQIIQKNSQSSQISHKTLKISNFFTKNKSLKLLIGDLIQKPSMTNTYSQKVESFSKTDVIIKYKT